MRKQAVADPYSARNVLIDLRGAEDPKPTAAQMRRERKLLDHLPNGSTVTFSVAAIKALAEPDPK